MARLVVTAASFCANSQLVSEAKSAFRDHDLRFVPLNPASKAYEVTAAIDGADAVIAGREPYCADVLSSASSLKAVAKYGVGIDNVDAVLAGEKGIVLLESPGTNAFAVAEHTLGLMLNLLHNISLCDRKLREGTWYKNGGNCLSGKVIAVVGVGNVGLRVVRLLRAFDCKVLGVDILDRSEVLGALGASQTTLENALMQSDIFSFHVPLTATTRGWLAAPLIARMRPGAIVINTSRGEVAREEDILRALESGVLAGAGLDVFEAEPTENIALVTHPKVLATPHVAGNSEEAVLAMGRAAISVLAKWLRRD
jgi:phosphoglycerate dehydrogenase-like enzyme